MPRFCDVAVPVPLDAAFTYSIPEELPGPCVGGRVIVPFREKRLCGIVTELHDREPRFEAKPVLQVLDTVAALTPELMQLGRWIAHYYIAPIGEVLRTMLPLAAEFRRVIGIPHYRQRTGGAARRVNRRIVAAITQRTGAPDARVCRAQPACRWRDDARGIVAGGVGGIASGAADATAQEMDCARRSERRARRQPPHSDRDVEGHRRQAQRQSAGASWSTLASGRNSSATCSRTARIGSAAHHAADAGAARHRRAAAKSPQASACRA